MTLHLVRHAKAANRTEWEGDDADRPLTERGRLQADALADQLAPEATAAPDIEPGDGTVGDTTPTSFVVTRVVSSPSLRCRQTVQPVATRVGVEVELDDRLAEGAWPDEVLPLLDELPDNSVCCSHGDVIPAVIAALERRGMQIDSPPDWRKATTWELTRERSAYTSAIVHPPPR